MLKSEVVGAIVAQQFNVWSVTTVDDEYPDESVNDRVDATLRSLAISIQIFEKNEYKEIDKDDELYETGADYIVDSTMALVSLLGLPGFFAGY